MIKLMSMRAVALGAVACAAGPFLLTGGGCSSSSSNSSPGTTAMSTDSGSTTTTRSDGGTSTSTTCSAVDDILTIAFSPMYSASIPGDSGVVFQVPAIVAGVEQSSVTWSASNTSVALSADPSTGGILVTMLGSGTASTVTITAKAGGSCAQSTLNITSATLDDYNTGKSRYNDGVAMTMGMGAPPDGGYRYACTDCHAAHGSDSGAGAGFNDVAHTPEQTGGYTDEQLLAIVQTGTVPGYDNEGGTARADAGYFDPSIVPYRAWHQFHQWGLTTAEQKGIVVYLRSLTPTAQNGTSNFGGFGGGGPPPDGGYHFPDGGPNGPGPGG